MFRLSTLTDVRSSQSELGCELVVGEDTYPLILGHLKLTGQHQF